jgi:hypothetical protein
VISGLGGQDEVDMGLVWFLLGNRRYEKRFLIAEQRRRGHVLSWAGTKPSGSQNLNFFQEAQRLYVTTVAISFEGGRVQLVTGANAKEAAKSAGKCGICYPNYEGSAPGGPHLEKR